MTKVAVAIHVYYTELLPDILIMLNNIKHSFDIYITSSNPELNLSNFEKPEYAEKLYLKIYENSGRDIAPFIFLYRSGVLDKYNAVLKIHTKKSSYSRKGAYWRNEILSQLVGNCDIATKSIQLFQNSIIGIVGPTDFYLTHPSFWGANIDNVRKIFSFIAPEIKNSFKLGFFAGSMFWFNPCALMLLKCIPEPALKFGEEQGLQDGTLAHAYERIFCLIARHKGFSCTSTSLEGVDIDCVNNLSNKVPVLPQPDL
jgi:lipopolysaccharide biosynthesis protein